MQPSWTGVQDALQLTPLGLPPRLVSLQLELGLQHR